MTTMTTTSLPVNRVAVEAADRRERIAGEVDRAWWTGHTLGRDGVDAEPCREWEEHEKGAFRTGLIWGQIDREADMEAEEAEMAARALAHALAVEMSGLPCWDSDAYAMA